MPNPPGYVRHNFQDNKIELVDNFGKLICSEHLGEKPYKRYFIMANKHNKKIELLIDRMFVADEIGMF